MAKKRQAWATAEPFVLHIEDLTHDGYGIARRDGKVVFVEGALPGEKAACLYTIRRSRRDQARIVELLTASPQRVQPRCDHFSVCGGCALQHLDADAQLAAKQRWLLDSLTHIGKVEPEQVLPPLTGPLWGYRRRARLGVKWVAKKGRVLVGFRERASPYLADVRHCEVLDPRIGGLLAALGELIAALTIREQVPQIEIAGGDSAISLNFRVLSWPDTADLAKLEAFGRQHQLAIYLQPGGPESVQPLGSNPVTLSYQLPNVGVDLAFRSDHFIQINAAINRELVQQAIDWLQLGPQQRVLDLFCGLGNFTLPLAKVAHEVVGVEGDASLVEWARHNAQRNGIANATFYAGDLNQVSGTETWLQGHYDSLLLDPPRSGALALIPYLERLDAQRVVYVSCHPATLARDVGEWVHRYNYQLATTGIIDMFPHTAHVESVAVLIRR